MTDNTEFFSTNEYRCLVYHLKQTEDIYLISCGIETVRPGKVFQTDSRPGYHLHVVLSGKGTLRVNDEETHVHSGQLFMTKPGERVNYWPDPEDPWTYCWMSFDGNNAAGYCESCGFAAGVNVLACHVELRRFYDLNRQVLEKPELNVANDIYRLGTLLQFISLAIESNYHRNNGGRFVYEYGRDAYVERALSCIHQQYASVTVADIAKEIGIHRSYLTNIFKSKVGVSPQKYLLQYKMDMAAKLLRETALPVQEVSARIGYDNALTFSKMFKSVYGLSPRAYRNQGSPGQEDTE